MIHHWEGLAIHEWVKRAETAEHLAQTRHGDVIRAGARVAELETALREILYASENNQGMSIIARFDAIHAAARAALGKSRSCGMRRDAENFETKEGQHD